MESMKRKRYENSEGISKIDSILTFPLPFEDVEVEVVSEKELTEKIKGIQLWNRNNKEVAKHVEQNQHDQFIKEIEALDVYCALKRSRHQLMRSIDVDISETKKTEQNTFDSSNSRMSFADEKPMFRVGAVMGSIAEKLKKRAQQSAPQQIKPKPREEKKKIVYMPAGYERDTMEFLKHNNC